MEALSHDSAGAEHTDAEQGFLNFKKLMPKTVIMLPGNAHAGEMLPKLRFVMALENNVIPSMAFTNKFLGD